MKRYVFILFLTLLLAGCSWEIRQWSWIQWKNESKKESSFERYETKSRERKEEKRKQISTERLQLLQSVQVKEYLQEIVSSIQKNTLTLLPWVGYFTGTIRNGTDIPLYKIGEYYLWLCWGQGTADHYMCIQSQSIPSSVMNDEEYGYWWKAKNLLETPFYGLIVAKTWDNYRLPLLEVEDIGDYQCEYEKSCWGQSHLPYALWIQKWKLYLSVVIIWNGAGSGEGMESVFELTKTWERSLVGCYDFTPDIYREQFPEIYENNLYYTYDTYKNSINYISTMTHGFASFDLDKCKSIVQLN